jgi:hypothetical protein
MSNRPYEIQADHHEFLKENSLSLSGLVQTALDDVMNGDREIPDRTQRDTYNPEFNTTSVSLTQEHAEFVAQSDFSFTIFVQEVLEERLERERMLQELDE